MLQLLQKLTHFKRMDYAERNDDQTNKLKRRHVRTIAASMQGQDCLLEHCTLWYRCTSYSWGPGLTENTRRQQFQPVAIQHILPKRLYWWNGEKIANERTTGTVRIVNVRRRMDRLVAPTNPSWTQISLEQFFKRLVIRWISYQLS